MIKRSSSDFSDDVWARVRLRHMRTKPVYRGPALIGRISQRLARKALPAKGGALARLQLEWPDIVNAQLAKLCRPEKLGRTNGGRVLTLKVLPAAAGLVQHQVETIRQRVSVAAGGDIVAVKIIQGYFRDYAQKSSQQKPSLPLEEEQKLIGHTQTITSKPLRAALVALGRAVLADRSESEKNQAKKTDGKDGGHDVRSVL